MLGTIAQAVRNEVLLNNNLDPTAKIVNPNNHPPPVFRTTQQPNLVKQMDALSLDNQQPQNQAQANLGERNRHHHLTLTHPHPGLTVEEVNVLIETAKMEMIELQQQNQQPNYNDEEKQNLEMKSKQVKRYKGTGHPTDRGKENTWFLRTAQHLLTESGL